MLLSIMDSQCPLVEKFTQLEIASSQPSPSIAPPRQKESQLLKLLEKLNKENGNMDSGAPSTTSNLPGAFVSIEFILNDPHDRSAAATVTTQLSVVEP